jgi:hypothetical protein
MLLKEQCHDIFLFKVPYLEMVSPRYLIVTFSKFKIVFQNSLRFSTLQ